MKTVFALGFWIESLVIALTLSAFGLGVVVSVWGLSPSVGIAPDQRVAVVGEVPDGVVAGGSPGAPAQDGAAPSLAYTVPPGVDANQTRYGGLTMHRARYLAVTRGQWPSQLLSDGEALFAPVVEGTAVIEAVDPERAAIEEEAFLSLLRASSTPPD